MMDNLSMLDKLVFCLSDFCWSSTGQFPAICLGRQPSHHPERPDKRPQAMSRPPWKASDGKLRAFGNLLGFGEVIALISLERTRASSSLSSRSSVDDLVRHWIYMCAWTQISVLESSISNFGSGNHNVSLTAGILNVKNHICTKYESVITWLCYCLNRNKFFQNMNPMYQNMSCSGDDVEVRLFVDWRRLVRKLGWNVWVLHLNNLKYRSSTNIAVQWPFEFVNTAWIQWSSSNSTPMLIFWVPAVTTSYTSLEMTMHIWDARLISIPGSLFIGFMHCKFEFTRAEVMASMKQYVLPSIHLWIQAPTQPSPW